MHPERHERLSRLIDRSLRASTGLVIVLTAAVVASVAGLLAVQHDIRDSLLALPGLRLPADVQSELTRMSHMETVILSVAGVLLLVLVTWAVWMLRRSRQTARHMLDSLDEALRESERSHAEMEAFIDAAPMGVFRADREGFPSWLNAEASQRVATGDRESVGRAIRDSVHPDDRDRVIGRWRDMVGGGPRFDEVFQFRTPSGSTIWAHVTAAPVRVGGEAAGFIAMMQDVTAERTLQIKLDRSRARLQKMIDNVPALIARVDAQGRYLLVNGTYRTWFGNAAPKVGDTLETFLGPDTYRRLRPAFERVLSGRQVRFEIDHDLHGMRFVADATYTPDVDEQGNVRGFYILLTDISERKRLEESLYEAKEMAQVTLDSIGDAVITTDDKGIVTFVNRRAEELLGLPASKARARPIGDIVTLVDSLGRATVSSLARAMEEQRVVDVLQPRKLVLPDGGRVDIEDMASPIHDRDGVVVGGVLILRDVSVAQAMADRMRQLAEADPLTGLPNRMVFDERLRHALMSLHNQQSLAVLYMDLDGFKAVNDVHGHGAGDELLRQLAQRLRDEARPTDTVCRLGGDEFVVLLAPPVTLADAKAVAERFVTVTALPFLWHGEPLRVTLSVGVALAPRHGNDPHALLRKADAALYAAKDAGRNQIRVAQ
jgi:diguanylate cyclase (GGDEF)-like protein/PAS domain S-box-containing protein